MDGPLNREVQERVTRTEEQVNNLRREMSDIKTDIQMIREIVLSARGGWKVAILMGGIAGGAFTMAERLVNFFRP